MSVDEPAAAGRPIRWSCRNRHPTLVGVPVNASLVRPHPGPWRVFLSHTSELSAFPESGSFVEAAKRAVTRAGHTIVQMDTWTASPLPPDELCRSRMRDCDVYVGVLGFRYGSPVRGAPNRSYTELEFDTATELLLPRLLFLLDEQLDVAVPPDFLVDNGFGDRQKAFRARVDESGVTRASARSPHHLELLVHQALVELAGHRGDRSGPRLSAFPPDRPDFTGRHEQVRQLIGALEAGPSGRPVTVHGRPGVGKSALAVHVAHRLSARFPDALVHLDLRGADRRPISSMDALEQLLTSFGVPPDEMAAGQPGRVAQYREVLAGMRALVVLDNAHSAAQLRPLIPTGPQCAALVTSRQPMSALEGAILMPLDALDDAEGADLLQTILGDDPRTGDRSAIDQVVRLCDRLPLAIGIAAAQLRSRPHWSVRNLVDRLADEHRRLSLLEVEDLAVRASFDSSYVELPDGTADAFAALGGLGGPDFPAWTLAALLDTSLVDAEDLLEELAYSQLIAFSRVDVTGAHRYRCHDLVRVYAREKSRERFDDPTRRASRERLFSGYLDLLLTLMSDHGPGKDRFLAEAVPIVWRPPAQVLEATRAVGLIAWFVDERAGLVAAAHQSSEDSLWPYTWGIVDALNWLFVVQGHGGESLELKDLALQASRRAEDPVAEAGVLYSYAFHHQIIGRHTRAVDVLHDVLARYRELDMPDRVARTMNTLGNVERDRGRLSPAHRYLSESLALLRESEDAADLRGPQHNLSIVLREQGHLAEARRVLDECLPMFVAHGDTGVGRVLHTRALLNRYVGRYDDARSDLEEARPHCVRAGDPRWTGIVDLGRIRLLGWLGSWSDALAQLPGCEQIFRDGEDDLGIAQVHRTQGVALRALGDPGGALARFRRAAEMYRDTDDERMQARLRYSIALTHLQLGDPATAAGELAATELAFRDLQDDPWLLRTRRWQAEILSDDAGRVAAQDVWAEVGQLAGTLIERAGAGHHPVWLDPILVASG